MDTLDYKILECLRTNARQSASDISKKIHLSVSTVIERIRKMEASGIIKSYTAVLDEKKLGNDVTALMEVSLEHPKYYESFTDGILKNPNIISCYYLAANFDFLLKIVCRSSEHLEEIHRWIKVQPGVSSTRTHYVLKDLKNIYSAALATEGAPQE
ncbi:MAG: Lrp/AsnC family transcriptional regulator [Candidatus Limivivens sp.]|nr:Lrp/AsnC family transcriptional regulator [Candidatus Limivivens sp.]